MALSGIDIYRNIKHKVIAEASVPHGIEAQDLG
jgi:hypothetical protein